MYHDIKHIEQIDTRVNFIIKCDDEYQLSELKNLLSVNKKMVTYEEFINQLSKNSSK